MDTMANATFLRPCMQQYMHNITDCQARIQVANAQSMSASVQGDLGMYVINMEGHNAIPMIQPFTVHGIIPPDLSRDLMSVDELYKNGYSILFKHSTYGDGIPELFHPGMTTEQVYVSLCPMIGMVMVAFVYITYPWHHTVKSKQNCLFNN